MLYTVLLVDSYVQFSRYFNIKLFPIMLLRKNDAINNKYDFD